MCIYTYVYGCVWKGTSVGRSKNNYLLPGLSTSLLKFKEFNFLVHATLRLCPIARISMAVAKSAITNTKLFPKCVDINLHVNKKINRIQLRYDK